MNRIKIGNFQIGGKKTFIVAELSANHNGSLKTALKSIRAAKEAGADCIKLQTYTPDTITLNSKKEDFVLKDTIWKGKNLYELYESAYTPWEWHRELYNEARKVGLEVFSSPFDKTSVDFLEKLNTPAYKIASFEITDIPLIKYIAKQKKPIIISTGIASLKDINLAIKTCNDEGNNLICLLKCTSSYPSPIEEANLKSIKYLKSKYNLHVGLSDHTLGIISPIIAVSYGAKIIEKHFIIDKKIGGPDSSFSLDYYEFKQMVRNIRESEKIIGKKNYRLTESMKKGKKLSKSIYVSKKISKGDLFTHDNIRVVRPGFGLHPKYFEKIIGKKSNQNIEKGERLEKKMIECFN